MSRDPQRRVARRPSSGVLMFKLKLRRKPKLKLKLKLKLKPKLNTSR